MGVKGILRRRYGASAAHLVGHLVLFAVAAYALGQLLHAKAAADIFLWLLGAIVVHDFLLLPVYSGLDRAARRAAPRLVNHVRVPAALSGLLLLVYFPPILGRNESTFSAASGHTPAGRGRDWLLITAGLFLLSAVAHLARRRRGRRM